MCKVLCQRYNSHIVSVCASPLCASQKKPFLCTNPELLQRAISIDIIPWSDICHAPKASLKQGVTEYVHSHLLY